MRKSIRRSVVLVLALLVVGIASAQDDSTVYVTKSGSKYHKAGCGFLKKSSGVAMKLSEVGDRYSPCSRCKPPILKSSSKPPQESKSGNSKSSKKNSEVKSDTLKKSGETAVGTTPTGKTIFKGPRGGQYHYNDSGKKVNERKKR